MAHREANKGGHFGAQAAKDAVAQPTDLLPFGYILMYASSYEDVHVIQERERCSQHV